MPEYTVRQGDTAASIAHERGLLWTTIWNHPDNEELRSGRDNPNVLHAGDVILIPEKEAKEESGATEQRHLFRRKGVPERLCLRLLDENDEPRADLSYTLEIDGREFTGTTDCEGLIDHPIPPDASQGRVLIGESREEEYELNLGHLDPIDAISGVQARLTNLGLYAGEVNGEMNAETSMAIKEFQQRNDLEENGEVNDETRNRLVEVHGS